MKRRTSFVLIALALLPAFLNLPSLAQDNPFFTPWSTPFETPPFDRIQNSHFLPAVEEGIRQQQAEIDAIANNPEPATFENTLAALDASGELLGKVAGVFYSLLGTVTSQELQDIAEKMSPLWSVHSDNIWLNEKLFARVKAVYDHRADLKLAPDQLYLLENTYRDFIRSGSLLNDEQKARLREINKEHSLLLLKFGDNLLSETNDSYIVIDNRNDLAGLPDGIIAMGEETARSMNMPGKWVFTTQRPSWTPFLTYSSVRPLREKLYSAYAARGNRNNEHDNKDVIRKIFELREERSRMLGFATPADFYMDVRMARTPATVDSFLTRLWTPALSRAKTELTEMQAICDSEQCGYKIASWDWFYYAEKLRKAKYDLDDAALRPYFSLANVQKGVFALAEKLYGLKFVGREDIPVYHPDVSVYEVREENGDLVGLLYTDFYVRDSKQGGAWSGEFRSSYYRDGKRVIPLSTLTCNFPKPTPDAPSLLSIDEAETYFHEFGHCIHGLFYGGRYRFASMPEDVVELPSQIMENWAVEPEMLKMYARHYKTGDVIPDSLIQRLKNSELFNQGFANVEYLAACYLDMAWHEQKDAKSIDVNDFEGRVMAEIGLIPEILPRYHSTYFSHMLESYEAGYYVYFWAGVLDSDAFQAFKETSLFDRKTAASFRENILAKLGTEDAMTLYKRFRGREPKVEPFLKKRGLL